MVGTLCLFDRIVGLLQGRYVSLCLFDRIGRLLLYCLTLILFLGTLILFLVHFMYPI